MRGERFRAAALETDLGYLSLISPRSAAIWFSLVASQLRHVVRLLLGISSPPVRCALVCAFIWADRVVTLSLHSRNQSPIRPCGAESAAGHSTHMDHCVLCFFSRCVVLFASHNYSLQSKYKMQQSLGCVGFSVN